jgi:[ribosomal protein S5]-alanine N-acetyltransferase
MNVTLETQRLLLTPITVNDTKVLHDIFVDPYVRKYLCDDTILPIQSVEEMAIENQKRFDQENLGLWFIQTKPESKTIGFAGLWYFFDEEQPQLIYALLPTATQKGYATEAASKIVEYGFDQLGYDYLIASCNTPNLESQRLLNRLGMKAIEERIVDGNPLVFFRLEKPQDTAPALL